MELTKEDLPYYTTPSLYITNDTSVGEKINANFELEDSIVYDKFRSLDEVKDVYQNNSGVLLTDAVVKPITVSYVFDSHFFSKNIIGFSTTFYPLSKNDFTQFLSLHDSDAFRLNRLEKLKSLF